MAQTRIRRIKGSLGTLPERASSGNQTVQLQPSAQIPLRAHDRAELLQVLLHRAAQNRVLVEPPQLHLSRAVASRRVTCSSVSVPRLRRRFSSSSSVGGMMNTSTSDAPHDLVLRLADLAAPCTSMSSSTSVPCSSASFTVRLRRAVSSCRAPWRTRACRPRRSRPRISPSRGSDNRRRSPRRAAVGASCTKSSR